MSILYSKRAWTTVKWMVRGALSALFAFFFYIMIVHPHPYNTETVCFGDDSNVIFYASGYNPNDDPVQHITGNVRRIVETGEIIEGTCKGSWGVNPPRGREYWSIN